MNDIVWEIKKGDLVRDRIYTGARGGPGMRGAEEWVYEMGIVISDIVYESGNQMLIGPSVNVFMFKDKRIQCCSAGSIEIISHAQ
jgi:hypothetical protein